MSGPAGLFVLGLFVASPAPSPPPPSIRLIVTFNLPPKGPPQIVVENAAATPVVVAGSSYLALSSPGEDTPRYWARLDTQATPSRHGAVTLPSRGKVTASVNPADLSWATDRSGLSPEQPLARGVVPGPYTLQVQVQGPDGALWRSNEVEVIVGRSGTLRYK